MKAWETYFESMLSVVDQVRSTQKDSIEKAAEILANCTKNSGIIHLFGAGHSHLITEDVFYRASTLANVHVILEPSLTGMTEITKENRLEQLAGFGEVIVDYHQIHQPDVMILVSNSGNKPVTIDAALECKKRGVPVIAITNVRYSRYLNAKHPLGHRLADVADIVLDNCSMIGDAAVQLDHFKIKVGSTSTIPSVFILTALMVQTVDILVKGGENPDVYYNGSLDANDQSVAVHNQQLVDKYYYKIKNL